MARRLGAVAEAGKRVLERKQPLVFLSSAAFFDAIPSHRRFARMRRLFPDVKTLCLLSSQFGMANEVKLCRLKEVILIETLTVIAIAGLCLAFATLVLKIVEVARSK